MSPWDVRPEIRCAWRGPSLLITDPRGECGGEPFMGLAGLAGFYFREARQQPPPESLTAGVFDRVKALAETVLRG